MKAPAALLVLFLGIAAPAAHGESLIVDALRDNTLYAESDTLSNGLGQRMFAGRNGPGDTRRALIRFDVIIPAAATIDSVVLQLTVAQTQPGSREVALHRLLADWGEGTSAAGGGEGGGAPATAGDATWTKRFFGPVLAWSTAGGDYDAAASAIRLVGGLGAHEWRSPAMTADVAFWAANPSQNFGWAIVGVESGTGTAKAFNTRNATTAAARPRLVVHFTPGPTSAGPLPPATRLFPVQPNPFNPTATIRYQLGRPVRVRLDVHDARGRIVQVLVDRTMPAGPHAAVWRGDDTRRARVASGVYFARLRVEGEPPLVQKMVLVK